MRVKCLAPGNNGSVSFWFSYVSFRVYSFANARDTLFLPCDWRPLSSGVVWERENVILIEESHISWYCSSCNYHHHLPTCFSTLQQFLQRPCWFASFCSSWHLPYFTGIFLLAYHFKIGKQLLPCRFSPNHTSPSKTLFRARYSFILWACFEDIVNTNQL